MDPSTPASDFVINSADREAWLKERKHGIGASESPGILGAGKYNSGISVFADKIDKEPPVEENSERMALGQAMEPVILAMYMEKSGRLAWPSGVLLRSKRWPFMLATLDATTTVNGVPTVLELKNTQDRTGWGDGVPRHVWVQMQHSMAVTGYQLASLGVLLVGCEFKWCDVVRNDAFIEEALVPACEHFWGVVEAGGPAPQVDGSEASRGALKKLYPNDSGVHVTLSGEFIDLAEQRATLKETLKAGKEELTLLENRIKAEIGGQEATFAALPGGGEFSWKADKNGVRTLRYKEPMK